MCFTYTWPGMECIFSVKIGKCPCNRRVHIEEKDALILNKVDRTFCDSCLQKSKYSAYFASSQNRNDITNNFCFYLLIDYVFLLLVK